MGKCFNQTTWKLDECNKPKGTKVVPPPSSVATIEEGDLSLHNIVNEQDLSAAYVTGITLPPLPGHD